MSFVFMCMFSAVSFEFVLHSSNSGAPVAAVVCCVCVCVACAHYPCCPLSAVGYTFISKEISPTLKYCLYVSFQKKKKETKQKTADPAK